MKKTTVLLALCLAWNFLPAQQEGSILAKVDKNMSSKNRIIESSMTIHGKRSSRTLTAKTWSEGVKKSFTEYLSPAAEKGTKMLKLEGKLWIYSPGADRTIQISGNMLRQSVMGSDLSYEDMMDDRTLQETYTEKLLGEETVDGRNSTPGWPMWPTTVSKSGWMPSVMCRCARNCMQKAGNCSKKWIFPMCATCRAAGSP